LAEEYETRIPRKTVYPSIRIQINEDKTGAPGLERTAPYKEESMTNSPKEEPEPAVLQVECPLHEPIFFLGMIG
jgi:hypothetical protein